MRLRLQAGAALLLVPLLMAAAAPWLGTVEPNTVDFAHINVPPGTRGEFTLLSGEKSPHVFWLGTDVTGHDIYSRLLYGARSSLLIAIAVAVASVLCGTAAGLAAGYFRRVDGLLMRLMDALMAMPSLILAVMLLAFWRGGTAVVVLAITLHEIPQVARLVRSVVLSVREEPYVDAAVGLGTPSARLLWRHVMPSVYPPLLVQAAFIGAAAILIEAALSFLGFGLPADVPSWGGIMAGGRVQFTQRPEIVLVPGACLAVTVLGIQLIGDALRDSLEARPAWRLT